MDIKEIRKIINEYIDLKFEQSYYTEEMEKLFPKIRNKILPLLPQFEDLEVEDITWQEWGDIFFVFTRYIISMGGGYLRLSDYSRWRPEYKDLIKPAAIEVFLFLKLRKEWEKYQGPIYKIQRIFGEEIIHKPVNKYATYRDVNTKVRDIWKRTCEKTFVSREELLKIKKELEETSDEELLKIKEEKK